MGAVGSKRRAGANGDRWRRPFALPSPAIPKTVSLLTLRTPPRPPRHTCAGLSAFRREGRTLGVNIPFKPVDPSYQIRIDRVPYTQICPSMVGQQIEPSTPDVPGGLGSWPDHVTAFGGLVRVHVR